MTTTPNTTASGSANAGLHALADRIEEAQGRAICISVESADYLREALAASAPVAPAMVDMVPPATSRDRWMYEQGRLAERDPRTSKAAPVAPLQQGEYLPLPKPDTHCYDEDTGKDVWSHSAEQMRAYVDADRAARGAAQASPDGWKWMTHPSRNDGLPIPVRVFAEDGVAYYQPFDEACSDFEWESRDNDWREIAASRAQQKGGEPA